MDRDEHNHVAGRYNLGKLGIRLHRLKVRSELDDVAPRFPEIVDDRINEAPHNGCFNIGQRT